LGNAGVTAEAMCQAQSESPELCGIIITRDAEVMSLL